ncbi:MAG: hypothetical protein EAZ47_05000 [Bacteroidetes bacterium]|nr:MAG: hypothetical protein EAY72_01515 [Bacteroidota bacterium]TAE68540.1 MAG: hypothetical protein EAY68_04430 [Bacteroidota bacterium]TAF93982.1 MAG: hypothetical protein EAZ47_05000 [Bacteroidota bacterium]
MKFVLFIACLVRVFTYQQANAQMPNAEVLGALTVTKISAYQHDSLGANVLLLPVNYANFLLADTNGIHQLQIAQILSIHLVFTDYPKTASLQNLNTKRWQQLCALLPPTIQWNTLQVGVFRQTDGYDKATAEKLFHGFVIQYRPASDKLKKASEIRLIREATDSFLASIPVPINAKVNNWDYVRGGSGQRSITYKGVPVSLVYKDRSTAEKIARKNAQPIWPVPSKELIEKEIIFVKMEDRNRFPDTLYLIPRVRYTDKPLLTNLTADTKQLKDTALFTLLAKKPATNIGLVVDVTGSMSPYTAQVLIWLQALQYTKAIKAVTCFNDGNDKATAQKEIGRTGGIYTQFYTSYEALVNMIIKAMDAGDGGDLPENAVEAILIAQQKTPDVEELWLVADGWAPVRDIVLANQIQKPLVIFVNGPRSFVHEHYIELALKTKGQLLLPDGKRVKLQALLDNGFTEILGQQYQWKNNRVSRVK